MDIRKLNSATKYPSILTYHELGDRGRLTETIQVPFPAGQTVYVTEKVDGANGRLILLPENHPIMPLGSDRQYMGPSCHYMIGSREELLYAHNDLLWQPDYGIVEAIRAINPVRNMRWVKDQIQAYYFEVFGGDLPASKQYTSSKTTSLRIFDVARIPIGVLIAFFSGYGTGRRDERKSPLCTKADCMKARGLM